MKEAYRQECSFYETQEEPSKKRTDKVVGDSGETTYSAPEYHRTRNVQGWPRDFVQNHVGRDLPVNTKASANVLVERIRHEQTYMRMYPTYTMESNVANS